MGVSCLSQGGGGMDPTMPSVCHIAGLISYRASYMDVGHIALKLELEESCQ